MTQHDLDQYERDTVWPKERHSKTWICIKETQWDARQCYSDTVMAWDSVRKLFPFLSDLSLFLLGFLSLSLLGLLSHSLLSFCSDTLIGWVLCYSKLWSFKAHSTLYEVKESGTVLKIYYIIYIRIKLSLLRLEHLCNGICQVFWGQIYIIPYVFKCSYRTFTIASAPAVTGSVFMQRYISLG